MFLSGWEGGRQGQERSCMVREPGLGSPCIVIGGGRLGMACMGTPTVDRPTRMTATIEKLPSRNFVGWVKIQEMY